MKVKRVRTVFVVAVEHGTAALEKLVFAELNMTNYELDGHCDESSQAELFASFYNCKWKTDAEGYKYVNEN